MNPEPEVVRRKWRSRGRSDALCVSFERVTIRYRESKKDMQWLERGGGGLLRWWRGNELDEKTCVGSACVSRILPACAGCCAFSLSVFQKCHFQESTE